MLYRHLVTGDFNGDSYQDIISPEFENNATGNHFFRKNNGSGVFIDNSQVYTGMEGLHHRLYPALDIDNDGDLDLGVIHSSTQQNARFFHILLNRNQRTLNLKAYLQGFYDQSDNSLRSDTLTAVLRHEESPFQIVETSKAIVNSDGNAVFKFVNYDNRLDYYVQTNHRNSIETWSSVTHEFIDHSMDLDLSASSSQAFGNNQIQIDSSPLRYAIYGGDINQDGVVDVSDLSIVYNANLEYLTGYVPSDVTGDNVVDISDIVLVFNNSTNFVSVVRP
jgi:hypothetical protein